jgi:hypothetical protein
MRSGYLLAALAAFVAAAPAIAGDKDQKSDQKNQQDAPKEKKVCHTDTVTGSLIAKRRICKTEAEWEQLAQDTKKGIDDFTSRQNGSVDPLKPSPFAN